MKKKKIIILIMIVIGILLIILATFFQKSVNIKQEYESIIYIYQGNVLQINNYNNFLKIKNDSNYDKTISKIILKFNNNAHIELDRLDGKAYVYDKFGNNYAWGETLDDFIKRDNY